MRDVVFEWYIPYILDRKRMFIKAVLSSAAAVFLFDAVFFASGMLIPAVLLAAVGFFLFRSWKYEYEYVYVNGDFTVSKIIRKAKRKDVYHTTRLDMEDFTEGRAAAEGRPAKDFTSGRANAPVYTIKAKGEYVYIEPSEDFVDEMKKYYRVQAGV